jgi:transposase
MSHRIAARDPAATGFVVVARRWVAERSFGWLSHWNGLVRDRAGRLDVSAGRYALAAAASGIEAILNPVPLQNEAA